MASAGSARRNLGLGSARSARAASAAGGVISGAVGPSARRRAGAAKGRVNISANRFRQDMANISRGQYSGRGGARAGSGGGSN